MAAEHVLEDLLRRAAPYALACIAAELASAEKRVERTSEARRNLDTGSSRARVTTANKSYARACEHRDRLWSLQQELKTAVRRG